MSSSNNFNICPRCGNSNMLNAKYCSRCGGELKLPEEPIVCHNCRTRNTPMANFCRNCGAELKVGYATKLCTRCGSEVPAEQNVCTCGYVFANREYATPLPVRADGTVDTGVTATQTNGAAESDNGKKGKRGKKEKDNRVYSDKGGRAFAIIALILLLAFAYFIIVPSCVIRPFVVSNFDKGLTWYNPQPGETGDVTTDVRAPMYGYDMVMMLVKAIMSKAFGQTFVDNGGIVQAIIATLVVIFALALIVHFIVCLVRTFKPRRSRKPNWCFFALALLTTVVVGLIVLFNIIPAPSGVFAKIAALFKLAEGYTPGYVLYAIPIYFWFFFLYSLIAKARALKEQPLPPAPEGQQA